MPTLNVALTYASGQVRTLSSDCRREWAQDYLEAFHKVAAGLSTSGASIAVQDGAANASIAITFTGNGTAADTVTLGGQALTAVASGAANNQWNVGASAAGAAANFAACVNASTTFKGILSASVVGAVVTVTCLAAGTVGNLITAAKSSTAISALPSAALTGGTGNSALLLAY